MSTAKSEPLFSEAELADVLRMGGEKWNAWRQRNRRAIIRLPGVQMVGAELGGADLSGVDLTGAVLVGTDLHGANLSASRLVQSQLDSADLRSANLTGVDLTGASLTGSVMEDCKLVDAVLRNANLARAVFGGTILGNVDFRNASGLTSIRHRTASVIDFRTLENSGTLPRGFLQGCGVPVRVIDYLPTIFGEATQFYSVFLAYSGRDSEFANRLHTDLQSHGVSTWFAPQDLSVGANIGNAIDEAIRVHDKLLIVLSEQSVASRWVEQEIEAGLTKERVRGETVLLPLRLDNSVIKSDKGWAQFLRSTHQVADFREWQDSARYGQELQRLLRALRRDSVGDRERASKSAELVALTGARLALESAGMRVIDVSARRERFDLLAETANGRTLRVEVKQLRWVQSLDNRLAELTYAAVQGRIDLAILVEIRDNAAGAVYVIPADDLRAGVPGLQAGRTHADRLAAYQAESTLSRIQRSTDVEDIATTGRDVDASGTEPNSGVRLTLREMQVAYGIATGKSYSDIAEDLSISPSTAKRHAENLRAKLSTQHGTVSSNMGIAAAWMSTLRYTALGRSVVNEAVRLGRAPSLAVGPTEQARQERLAEDTRDLGLVGHRRYFLQAWPLASVELPNLHDRTDAGLRTLIALPSVLRSQGFGLRTLDTAVLIGGGGIRVNANRWSLSLQPDGLLTWVVTAGPEFLAWADEGRGQPLSINPIALVESTLEFSRFFVNEVLPRCRPAPESWAINGGMADLDEGGDMTTLTPGGPTSGTAQQPERPADATFTFGPKVQHGIVAGVAALDALEGVYRNFGLPQSEIPYTRDGAVDEDSVRRIQ